MFKFVLLCAFVVAASAVNRNSNFGHHSSASSSDDVHAEIRSYKSDVRADGFEYAFDTTNGIQAQSSGDAYGNMHGDFSWTSPEGEHIAIVYVADENGYQPSGAALPTPPPVPAAILRSLEYIRTHPSKEEHGRHF